MNPVDVVCHVARDAIRRGGRTQAQIAAELGISQKHLSEFMHGWTELSLPMLHSLCRVLGMEWENVSPDRVSRGCVKKS